MGVIWVKNMSCGEYPRIILDGEIATGGTNTNRMGEQNNRRRKIKHKKGGKTIV